MKRILTLLLLILLCWLPLAHAQPAGQTRTLVFTHVTVDLLRGALNKDMTVVITGNRIRALGNTGRDSFSISPTRSARSRKESLLIFSARRKPA